MVIDMSHAGISRFVPTMPSQPQRPVSNTPVRTLILSPVPSHPVTTGWAARLNHLAQAMEAMGHEVEYAYIPDTGIPCDTAGMARHWGRRLHVLPVSVSAYLLAQRPVGTRIADRIHHQIRYRMCLVRNRSMARLVGRWDTWYGRETHQYLSALQRERSFDFVIVQYGVFSRAFHAFKSGTSRLLDTNDLCVARNECMQRVGLTARWSTTQQEETRHLNRADIILAITDEEAQAFSRLSRRPVRVVGHLAPVASLPKASPSSGTDILFVGSKNAMNAQAARFLTDDILPRLRARVPGARLLIAGAVCCDLSPGEGYALLGVVENLRPVYERAALVVNPMLAGTGLAIKTVEALGHGKPVVATQIGARGLLRGTDAAISVADGSDEFAAAVARILETPQLLADLALAAHRFATQYRQRMIRNLQTCFDGPGAGMRHTPQQPGFSAREH